MDWLSGRENAFVSRKVEPGYLYDKSARTYSERRDGKITETRYLPASFSFEIKDFNYISWMKTSPNLPISQLVKDFSAEQPKDAIFVRGSKLQEEVGIGIPTDKVLHTVSSVLYVYDLDILIILKDKISKETLTDLKAYLDSVSSEAKESFLPYQILECFKTSYIYKLYSEPGKELVHPKYAFEQFCRILKESKLSSIPRRAILEKPLGFAEPSVENSVTKVTGINATAVHESGKNSVYNLANLQDDLASVHLGKENPKKPAPEIESQMNLRSMNPLIPKDNVKQTGRGMLTCQQKEGSLESWAFNGQTDLDSTGKGHGARQAFDHDKLASMEILSQGRGRGTRVGRGYGCSPQAVTMRIGNNFENSNNECFIQKQISSKNAAKDVISVDCHSVGSLSINSMGKDEERNKAVMQNSQKNHVTAEKLSRVQEIKKNFENSESSCEMTDSASKQSQMTAPNETKNNCRVLSNFHDASVSKSDIARVNTIPTEEQKPTRNVTEFCITLSNQNVSLGSNGKNLFNNTQSPVPPTETERQGNIKSAKVKDELEKQQTLGLEEIDKIVEQSIKENMYFENGVSAGYNSGEHAARNNEHQSPPELLSQAACASSLNKDNSKKNRNNDMKSSVTDKRREKTEESANHKKYSKNEVQTSKTSQETRETQLQNGKTDVQSSRDVNNPNVNSFGKDLTSANQTKLYNALESDNGKVDFKNSKNNHGTKQMKRTKQAPESDDEKVNLKVSNKVYTTQSKRPKNGNQVIMKTKAWKPVKTVRDPCGLERKYYGIVNEHTPEKLILLLGASGSGKTTLINFMANYFKGNKSADDELIHVEPTVQTSTITAYTFCEKTDDIPITVIDTPGLNDSSGGEVRDHIQSLKTFLVNASSNNFEIHAIGFVAQAHLVRLTSSERLVMDYVSTMFGQNVSEHLITLVTFADTQDIPPVIEAMKTYEVKFKQFLKFNNSTLCNGKLDELDDLDRVYYRVCWKNWRKCLKTLKELPALSVNAMKAMQSEIYSTTVTKSAEKDLVAELKALLGSYQNNSNISKDNLKICEQIWELAAVVHRLRSAQNTASSNAENILLEFSESVCRANKSSPADFISLLSLAPSKGLTVGGISVIRTMRPLYDWAKKEDYNSSIVSKNISEWSYCHKCKEDHRMKRHEDKSIIKKIIPGLGQSSAILALQCVQCSCEASLHGISQATVLYTERVLRHTLKHLSEVVRNHSIQGYELQKERYLKFLNNYLTYEGDEFIDALLNMSK